MPILRYERPPLAPYQVDGFFSPQRMGLIEGTTKTGKNHTGMIWLFEQATLAAKFKNYWWCDPVYPQAAITYRRLRDAIPRGLRKPNDTELSLTIANGRVIWFKSMEKPDNLYGEDVGAAVINEASRGREESWWAVRSTLTKTRGPIRIIGNLKGRKNWFYQLCRRAETNDLPDAYHRRWISQQAVDAGLLDAAEVEAAKRELPDAIFKELYLGIPSDDGGNPFGLQFIAKCVAPISKLPAVCYGIDLAKSMDWTVIIGLDCFGRICHFERFQMPWKETKDRIRQACGSTVGLVDSTGVGDPVLEDLQRGGGYSRMEGFKFSMTSKQQIIEGLSVDLQQEQTSVLEGPLRTELESFEYQYTRSGVRYSAPKGMNDDCVYAFALARAIYREKGMHRAATSWQAGTTPPQNPEWA